MLREYGEAEDRGRVEPHLDAHWGGALQARRGELLDVLALPGFVVEEGGHLLGIATYRREGSECELAFVEAFERGRGVGSALVDAVVEAAEGCDRVWVVTTNDNLDALRFYQRLGFRLAELRVGAVDCARKGLKPQIPRLGVGGIPIRDELELELRRAPPLAAD